MFSFLSITISQSSLFISITIRAEEASLIRHHLSTLHTLLLRQPRANSERRAPPRTTTGAPLVLLSTDDRPRLTQFVRPLLCCVNASVPVGHRSRGGRAACPSSYAVARAFQSWRGVQSVPNHPAGLRIHPPGGNSSLHLGLLPSSRSD